METDRRAHRWHFLIDVTAKRSCHLIRLKGTIPSFFLLFLSLVSLSYHHCELWCCLSTLPGKQSINEPISEISAYCSLAGDKHTTLTEYLAVNWCSTTDGHLQSVHFYCFIVHYYWLLCFFCTELNCDHRSLPLLPLLLWSHVRPIVRTRKWAIPIKARNFN